MLVLLWGELVGDDRVTQILQEDMKKVQRREKKLEEEVGYYIYICVYIELRWIIERQIYVLLSGFAHLLLLFLLFLLFLIILGGQRSFSFRRKSYQKIKIESCIC